MHNRLDFIIISNHNLVNREFPAVARIVCVVILVVVVEVVVTADAVVDDKLTTLTWIVA